VRVALGGIRCGRTVVGLTCDRTTLSGRFRMITVFFFSFGGSVCRFEVGLEQPEVIRIVGKPESRSLRLRRGPFNRAIELDIALLIF